MSYPIPDAALETHTGILGKVGSGKSYTARGLAERLLHLGRQVVIIDPTGAWYGLRTGFEVPIFGGRHGDVEISDHAGEPVASVIVDKRASAIIDLSLMSGGGQKRFMRDFAHRLRQKPPGALYLFLDEADEFLPQEKVNAGRGNAASTDANLFGDLKWMVRRGRLNGFRVTMITQRPAEIAKAVLTQIETLVAHRLTAPQDRRAVEEWIKGHADPDAHKEVLTSLAGLEKGVAWVWAPDLDILVKEKMPPIETFDSGRTPEPGEIEVKPPALADLDLSAIKERLVAVEEEAKANDPRALKMEVARLTRELAAGQKGAVAPAWPDLREEAARLGQQAAEAISQRDASLEAISKAMSIFSTAQAAPKIDIPVVAARRTAPVPAPVQIKAPPREPRGNGSDGDGRAAEGITGPQRRLLNAVAWWEALGFPFPTRTQVAFIAGYKPNTGTFNTYLGALSTGGFIHYPRGGAVALTDGGRELAEAPGAAPNTQELHGRVKAILTGPQSRLLEVMLGSYPGQISRAELATASGYQPNTGTFNTYLGSLSTLGVISYPEPGHVRAADWLFP